MAFDLLALAGGLALLLLAANALVRGASALALRVGLSPLVVGLTVVAFGTSAPELVVSIQAALGGAGGIAVGNVVGSNVANIGLILGGAVLVRAIASDAGLLRRDLPVLIAATGLTIAFLWDRALGRVESGVLVLGLVAYLVWSVRAARREATSSVVVPDVQASRRPAWQDALWVVLGLGGLVFGADLFVDAAIGVAEVLGVPNAIIGLTVVAVGTSLPELATSLVAAGRGEAEIAVGNVVGSNLFNLLAILGTAGLVAPLSAPGLSTLDLGVLAGFTCVLAAVLVSGRRLVRAEGALLVLGYVVYVGVLVAQV